MNKAMGSSCDAKINGVHVVDDIWSGKTARNPHTRYVDIITVGHLVV